METSTGILDFTNQKRRRRSEYSKKGCRECKRRKIKCDEGKPSCWQCERLNKVCSYPEAGERVLRVSKKLINRDTLAKSDIKTEATDSDRSESDHTYEEPPQGYQNHSPKQQIQLNHHHTLLNHLIHLQNHHNHQNNHQNHHQNHQNHHHLYYQHLNYPLQPPPPPIPIPSSQSFYLGEGSAIRHPSNGAVTLPPPIPSRIPPIFPQSPAGGSESLHRYPPSSILNLLNDAKSPAVENGVTKPYSSPETIKSQSHESPTHSTTFNTPHPNVNEFSAPTALSSISNDSMMLLGSDNYQFFNQEDLNLLASDLNNIVNAMMFESNFDNSKAAAADPGPTPSPAKEILAPKTNGRRQGPDPVPKNIPFNYIDVTKSHEKLYLEEFYNEFANVILPFNSYDKSLQCYLNPARDILLKCASQESFLLAAIFAQGAKSSFNKNNLPEDEEAYCSYLSKCLKLLGPALGVDPSTKDKNSLTSNIEAVLLTVLLLTSSNASNTKQNWRPHLRGAKDLLIKNTASKARFRNSKILVFCKFWYMSIEILAGLSSKLGGTLKTDAEIDLLITSGDKYEIKVLKELGLILDNGFNLIGGYHNDCAVLLRDVIKILNKSRNDKAFVPSDTFDYVRLLSQFYNQSQIEFFNQKCILRLQDFKDGVVPDGQLLDVTTVQREKIVISWMDLSQQSYVLASMITILTKCFQLPYNSPQVQDLTTKIISLLLFLGETSETPQLIKCSVMMIQWPMLVAGLNCVQEHHKFLIMKFFRTAAHIGSGSAGFALRKINHIWSLHEMGKESDTEDEANIDIVSY